MPVPRLFDIFSPEHVDVVGHLVGQVGEFEHRRPEQGVEVDDVLADEMHLLGSGQHLLEIQALPGTVVLQAGEVADRRVQPDVEVLLLGDVRDADAEIGRVARDVPVAQRLVALALEPLACLVGHLRLQAPRQVQPFAQERHALLVREPEKVVLGGLQHRRGARQRRIGVDQLGGRVDRTAHFAGVAVLVLGAALGALALDVAVGQEHALHRVVELLDRLAVDQPGAIETTVDVLRELGVLGRVGRVPVVEGDVKAVQVLLAPGGDAFHQLLGGQSFSLGLEHDRRAVRVVGADEMHGVALHALEAHPDVGLDVLHDVADMERPVGIGQRGGDE
jgi:hypothetical protein